MGSEVTATCPCGLERTIPIGGGMMSFTTICYFPCLCDRCHDVVRVNLLAKWRRCLRCGGGKLVPYDSPALCAAVGTEVVAEWNAEERLGRSLVLTNGRYKCPQCDQFTLAFSDGGLLWD